MRADHAPTAAAAMDYYDMHRVKGETARGLTVPTQRRFVRYYERMLKCGVLSSAHGTADSLSVLLHRSSL